MLGGLLPSDFSGQRCRHSRENAGWPGIELKGLLGSQGSLGGQWDAVRETLCEVGCQKLGI